MRDFRPAVGMQLASTGGVEPRALRPSGNDLSGRCNRGSRTLDTAVMNCLLYPTELHCSGGHGCVGRGYTQQQHCSMPVWLEPQPLAPNISTKTSVTMGRIAGHPSKFVCRLSGTERPLNHSPSHNDDDCPQQAAACIRELLGTPRSRNSIWSARILRLLRMKASYRFGTYGT